MSLGSLVDGLVSQVVGIAAGLVMLGIVIGWWLRGFRGR